MRQQQNTTLSSWEKQPQEWKLVQLQSRKVSRQVHPHQVVILIHHVTS